MKPIAVNRKAKFDYFIYDRWEAGVCLTGYEIKSIREQNGDLKLVRMIPDVYEIFELLEFHHILVNGKPFPMIAWKAPSTGIPGAGRRSGGA